MTFFRNYCGQLLAPKGSIMCCYWHLVHLIEWYNNDISRNWYFSVHMGIFGVYVQINLWLINQIIALDLVIFV